MLRVSSSTFSFDTKCFFAVCEAQWFIKFGNFLSWERQFFAGRCRAARLGWRAALKSGDKFSRSSSFLFLYSYLRPSMSAGLFSPGLPRVYQGKPGPWGRIEYTRIAIEPPTAYLNVTLDEKFDRGSWIFKNFNAGGSRGAFRASRTHPAAANKLTQVPWDPRAR